MIIFIALLFVWSILQNPPELPAELQEHEISRHQLINQPAEPIIFASDC